MPEMIPLTEARDRLPDIVRRSDEDDVVLLRHGRPVAVVLSAERHIALLEHIEDLTASLAVLTAEGDTIPMGEAFGDAEARSA